MFDYIRNYRKKLIVKKLENKIQEVITTIQKSSKISQRRYVSNLNGFTIYIDGANYFKLGTDDYASNLISVEGEKINLICTLHREVNYIEVCDSVIKAVKDLDKTYLNGIKEL